MGKREDNRIAKSQASVRDMVDAVTAGDLSAAGEAFDALVSAKRDHEWVNAKHDLARTAFEYETIIDPEVDPTPIDTGITGDPAEIDEQRPSQKKIRKMGYVDQATQAHVDGDFKKRDAILKAGGEARKKKQAAEGLGSQPGYKLGKRTDHDETPVKTPASRRGKRDQGEIK